MQTTGNGTKGSGQLWMLRRSTGRIVTFVIVAIVLVTGSAIAVMVSGSDQLNPSSAEARAGSRTRSAVNNLASLGETASEISEFPETATTPPSPAASSSAKPSGASVATKVPSSPSTPAWTGDPKGSKGTCDKLPQDSIARGTTVNLTCLYEVGPQFIGGAIGFSCFSSASLTCYMDPAAISPKPGVPVQSTLTIIASGGGLLGPAYAEIVGGIMMGNNQSKPPLTRINFQVVDDPAHPPPALQAPGEVDFSILCDSYNLTIQAGSTGQFGCTVSAGNFRGKLIPLVAPVNGESFPDGVPYPNLSPAPEIVSPSGTAFTLTVDASGAPPGIYSYRFTFQPEGNYTFAIWAPDRTKTITFEIIGPAPADPTPPPASVDS